MIETVQLTNGSKVHFKKDPRYGFWTVNFDRGSIPKILSGRWQSLPELKAKTNHYLKNRQKPAEFKAEETQETVNA